MAETAGRERELRGLPKRALAVMHRNAGGLLSVAEYCQWTKDELVAAVLEDERLMRGEPR